MNKFFSILILVSFLALNIPIAEALTATGLVGGSAITSTDGIDAVSHVVDTTSITTKNLQGANSTVNWGTLNVGSNQTLNFNFTAQNQTVLNKVNSGLTNIAGQITNNGIGADTSRVIIANPNGIMLDKGGYINTNAILLTSLEDINITSSKTGAVDYYFINMRPKNYNIGATPKTGIVLQGKIDTKNDVVVAAKGIRVEGAQITSGGNTNLVSSDDVSFKYNGPVRTTSNGQMFASNEGNLKLNSWGNYNRTEDQKNPLSIKYVDGKNSPDNILIKSASNIKSQNGTILLLDTRDNTAGINIDSSTMTAQNSLKLYRSNFVKIKNLQSDSDTDLDINIASYGKYIKGAAAYGEALIDGIKEVKSLSINLDGGVQTVDLKSININDVHCAKVISKAAAKTTTISNSTINNDFALQSSAATEIASQKAITNVKSIGASSSNSDSLAALNSTKTAKLNSDLTAAEKGAQDAQTAADQAALNASAAKTASDKATVEQNKIAAQDAVTGVSLKVSDRNAQAKTNAQDAAKAAQDAQDAANQASKNAADALQLAKDTKVIVTAQDAAFADVITQKNNATTAYDQASSSNSESFTALNAVNSAKSVKDVTAANKAAKDAQDAADTAKIAYLAAQNAADKAAVSKLQVGPKDVSKAHADAQSAADAAANAKLAYNQASKNASDALKASQDTKVLADSHKDDVNKMPNIFKDNINTQIMKSSENLLAQNIKSFAANEILPAHQLYKKTAQGFTIVAKIAR